MCRGRPGTCRPGGPATEIPVRADPLTGHNGRRQSTVRLRWTGDRRDLDTPRRPHGPGTDHAAPRGRLLLPPHPRPQLRPRRPRPVRAPPPRPRHCRPHGPPRRGGPSHRCPANSRRAFRCRSRTCRRASPPSPSAVPPRRRTRRRPRRHVRIRCARPSSPPCSRSRPHRFRGRTPSREQRPRGPHAGGPGRRRPGQGTLRGPRLRRERRALHRLPAGERSACTGRGGRVRRAGGAGGRLPDHLRRGRADIRRGVTRVHLYAAVGDNRALFLTVDDAANAPALRTDPVDAQIHRLVTAATSPNASAAVPR